MSPSKAQPDRDPCQYGSCPGHSIQQGKLTLRRHTSQPAISSLSLGLFTCKGCCWPSKASLRSLRRHGLPQLIWLEEPVDSHLRSVPDGPLQEEPVPPDALRKSLKPSQSEEATNVYTKGLNEGFG